MGPCLRPQANNGMLHNGGQSLASRAVVCFQKCRAHWSILLTLEILPETGLSERNEPPPFLIP
jgi:hypothetical protein